MEELHKEKGWIVKLQQNLTAFLLDGTITREDYMKEKPKFETELQTVLAPLENNMDRVKRWEQAVRDAIDLSSLAKSVFENSDDIEGKKIVLQAIGSNFLLKDKKLNVVLKNRSK